MEIAYLLVPFVTSGILQGVKWLAGLYLSQNGPAERVWLRTLLIIFSFFGMVASSLLNGTPLDANTVTDDVRAVLGTLIAAYLSHAFYKGVSAPSARAWQPRMACVCSQEPPFRSFCCMNPGGRGALPLHACADSRETRCFPLRPRAIARPHCRVGGHDLRCGADHCHFDLWRSWALVAGN
jgi:hypothetical protein